MSDTKTSFSYFQASHIQLHAEFNYHMNSQSGWKQKAIRRTINEQVSSDKCLIMYWKYWVMHLGNTLNQEFRPTLQTSFLLMSHYASYKSISNFWSRQTFHNKPTLYWNANPSITWVLKKADIQHMLLIVAWLAKSCLFFLKKQRLQIIVAHSNSQVLYVLTR